MKNLISKILTLTVFALPFMSVAETDPWTNRPNVILAGEKLLLHTEGLDEALHNAKAPKHVVTAMHNLETRGDEFMQLVKSGGTFSQASSLFHKIHLALHSLEHELEYHHYLLHIVGVANKWKAVNIAYNNLDLEMYHFKEAKDQQSID